MIRWSSRVGSWGVSAIGFYLSMLALPSSVLLGATGAVLSFAAAYALHRRSTDHGSEVTLPTQMGHSWLGWWVASGSGKAWTSEEGARARMRTDEAPRLVHRSGRVEIEPWSPTEWVPFGKESLWSFIAEQVRFYGGFTFVLALVGGGVPGTLSDGVVQLVGAAVSTMYTMVCLGMMWSSVGYGIGVLLLGVVSKLLAARTTRGLYIDEHRVGSETQTFHLRYPGRTARLGFDGFGTYVDLENRSEAMRVYGDHREMRWLYEHVESLGDDGDESEVPEPLRAVRRTEA